MLFSKSHVTANRWDRKDIETLSGPPLYCTMDCTGFYFRDNRIKARDLTEEEKVDLAKVCCGVSG